MAVSKVLLIAMCWSAIVAYRPTKSAIDAENAMGAENGNDGNTYEKPQVAMQASETTIDSKEGEADVAKVLVAGQNVLVESLIEASAEEVPNNKPVQAEQGSQEGVRLRTMFTPIKEATFHKKLTRDLPETSIAGDSFGNMRVVDQKGSAALSEAVQIKLEKIKETQYDKDKKQKKSEDLKKKTAENGRQCHDLFPFPPTLIETIDLNKNAEKHSKGTEYMAPNKLHMIVDLDVTESQFDGVTLTKNDKLEIIEWYIATSMVEASHFNENVNMYLIKGSIQGAAAGPEETYKLHEEYARIADQEFSHREQPYVKWWSDWAANLKLVTAKSPARWVEVPMQLA